MRKGDRTPMSFINRRKFLTATAGAVAGMRAMPFIADVKQELLIPTDKPDEFGFRIMWYSPVPRIDAKTFLLTIGGLAERPQLLSLEQLRRYPQVTESSRMKCVQCSSSRATCAGLGSPHLLEPARPLNT